MQILDYAMKMETDGERFYRDAASKTTDVGLSRILTMLADEEKKHFKVLEKLKAEGNANVEAGSLTTDAKNLFEQLQESNARPSADDSQLDLYAKAREIEEASRRFYLQKADESGSPETKAVFLKIAEQEKTHYQMLDTIVEFVSRPEPGNWLENAEWYHTDEY